MHFHNCLHGELAIPFMPPSGAQPAIHVTGPDRPHLEVPAQSTELLTQIPAYLLTIQKQGVLLRILNRHIAQAAHYHRVSR